MTNLNVEGSYNLLNECRYIHNKDTCIHDTNTGYEVLFNRGLDNWTTYSGLTGFRGDGTFLWCMSTQSECSIARAQMLDATFEADYFPTFEIDMLVRYDPNNYEYRELTGRVRWRLESDGYTWRDDSYMDFTVYPDGYWHRYSVIMLEHRYWVGDVSDLMVYPFVDGFDEAEVLIKRIACKSDYNYKCNYPPCHGHDSYSHPCPHTGTYARAYSTTRKRNVTIDDDNSRLGVSIDGYPVKYFDLDLSHCNDVWSVAQDISMKLNTLNLGGYKTAKCIYDPVEESFSIHTGTRGGGGQVQVYHGGDKDCTEELGFFTDPSTATWRFESGTDAVDGFSPAYYQLPATKLYRLPSSTSTVIDYDPSDPLVQIGRADILSLPSEQYMEEAKIEGTLMIDIYGKATYAGTISTLVYKGLIKSSSRLFLMRPMSDTSYQIIESIQPTASHSISTSTYEISVSWDVIPGDVLGLYNCSPALHGEDATLKQEQFYKFSWIEKINSDLVGDETITFQESEIRFFGHQSLPVYGYSDELMLNIGIEAELRYEYGVSHVAVIGNENTDYFDVNLMKLDTTTAQITTNSGAYTGLMEGSNINLLHDLPDDTEYFYIDFWFPGRIPNIYKIETSYEASFNLRAFSWEVWIEPENRDGLVWGVTIPAEEFPTIADYSGSEPYWWRFQSPHAVYLNDVKDVTETYYLGFSYVTNDPNDWFPGITEEEASHRHDQAAAMNWLKLSQTFPYVYARGVRLYCWKWLDSRINDVKIWATFAGTQSLVYAVDGVGISGPQVFDTESYSVTNVLGEVYSSSRISRAQTQDYEYALDFSVHNDDETIITAPVGTTMRILSLDVESVMCQIKQIKIIPQQLSVQIKAAGDEPIEEITNLSWGMPSDGSDYTYGPAQRYEICNDTGHTANLILGVANPLAINQACVFASDLSSYDSLEDPYRGLKGEIIESPNTLITNHESINYHARVYSPYDIDVYNWYSSTTSGLVWQTLVSGAPFPTTTGVAVWNEPQNPYDPNWAMYSLARASYVAASGAELRMALDARPVTYRGDDWQWPTYFQTTNQNDYLLMEIGVAEKMKQEAGVDADAGLVIFDNQDRSKYLRISRYSGNNLLAVSGTEDFNILHRDFGDYISYGDHTQYPRASGVVTPTQEINDPDHRMILRMIKDHARIDVAWRMSYDTWTTVTGYSVAGWSDDLRMGVFVAAVDAAEVTPDDEIWTHFDYSSYKKSTPRDVDTFDYFCDFSDLTTTQGRWTAYNADTTNLFYTTASSLYIQREMGTQDYVYFNNELDTPALLTTFGSVEDVSSITARLSGFDSRVLASGIFNAGFLLRDSLDDTSYIQFLVTSANTLLTVKDGVNIVTTVLDEDITTESGVWLRLNKGDFESYMRYSWDGVTYTTVTGLDIGNWDWDTELELALSTDLPEVQFDEVLLRTNARYAEYMAAQFDPPAPLLRPYGRQYDWSNIEYSGDPDIDEASFSSDMPDLVSIIKFEKAWDEDIDTDLVKFVPDISRAYRTNWNYSILEVPMANEFLYDRAGEMQVETPQITDSGTRQGDINYKGLSQYVYPVLAFDLGRAYELGRAKLAPEIAKGRFAETDTPYVVRAEFEEDTYEYSGFYRKCLLSSSDQCTAGTDFGKPRQTYPKSGGVCGYYYAGPCDGLITEAGDVWKACPLYTPGKARWLLLESNNYSTTTASAGATWFVSPIALHPFQRPLSATSYLGWWSTDYGELYWNEDDGKCLLYYYPGLSIDGSIYFNGYGSPYWRLSQDPYWTYEDDICVDLRSNYPNNIDTIGLRMGRDPNCYWDIPISGSLSTVWTTFSGSYREATLVVAEERGLEEPTYDLHDEEYYTLQDYSYMPMPFLNQGYIELTVSGYEMSDLSVKNIRHKRARFRDGVMRLGWQESMSVPDLDLTNEGTVQFSYYPSLPALNVIKGDPRKNACYVASIGNKDANISIVLSRRWGWQLYIKTPEEQVLAGFLPVRSEAEMMLPSETNQGPFEIVLSWAPDNLPGQTDNIMLWVDGHIACQEDLVSIGSAFNIDDMQVTLGKGPTVFDLGQTEPYVGYAGFSDLKIYKYSTGSPTVDLDNFALIPENLIELSLDGSDWKSFLAGDLPIRVQHVSHRDCQEFYVRNIRPRREIKELHKRHTAFLETMWEVTGID